MDVGKIPPNDIEAEQAVLGCMLLDGESVALALEVLKPDDFYREENKLIFSAMLNLYGRSEPIDLITVKEELVSLGKNRIYSRFIGESSNYCKCRQVCENC